MQTAIRLRSFEHFIYQTITRYSTNRVQTLRQVIKTLVANKIMNSYMNKTKWEKLLIPLVERNKEVKVKLTYHESNDKGEVVTAYDSIGRQDLLKFENIFSPSLNYYECGSIGPFKSSEIEWLEMTTKTYNELFIDLGIMLMTEERNDHIKVFGYK